MVESKNATCQYGRFHFECIGIEKAPEDSWYCDGYKQVDFHYVFSKSSIIG